MGRGGGDRGGGDSGGGDTGGAHSRAEAHRGDAADTAAGAPLHPRLVAAAGGRVDGAGALGVGGEPHLHLSVSTLSFKLAGEVDESRVNRWLASLLWQHDGVEGGAGGTGAGAGTAAVAPTPTPFAFAQQEIFRIKVSESTATTQSQYRDSIEPARKRGTGPDCACADASSDYKLTVL